MLISRRVFVCPSIAPTGLPTRPGIRVQATRSGQYGSPPRSHACTLTSPTMVRIFGFMKGKCIPDKANYSPTSEVMEPLIWWLQRCGYIPVPVPHRTVCCALSKSFSVLDSLDLSREVSSWRSETRAGL